MRCPRPLVVWPELHRILESTEAMTELGTKLKKRLSFLPSSGFTECSPKTHLYSEYDNLSSILLFIVWITKRLL